MKKWKSKSCRDKINTFPNSRWNDSNWVFPLGRQHNRSPSASEGCWHFWCLVRRGGGGQHRELASPHKHSRGEGKDLAAVMALLTRKPAPAQLGNCPQDMVSPPSGSESRRARVEDTQSLQRKNVPRGGNYLVSEVCLAEQNLHPSTSQTRTRPPARGRGTALERSNTTLFIVSHWVFLGLIQETMT